MTRERIDNLEEGLSRLVGDVAAHQVGRVLRVISTRVRGAGHTLAANIAEYLQEESRHLVTRTETDEFCRGVAESVEATGKLAARLERLLAGGGVAHAAPGFSQNTAGSGMNASPQPTKGRP